MDPAEYRERSLEIWQRMAAGWERNRDLHVGCLARRIRADDVAQLAPEPGDTILELAAGTGETGFAAAAVIGD